MKRSISVCILLGAAILAASCSDDTSTTTSSTAVTIAGSPATTTTAVTTTSATIAATTTTASTTSNPTTTSVAIDTAPTSTAVTPIAPDDWKAVLEELARRRVALYAAPDLSQIDGYCASGSDCASGLETQLADAIAKGQHVEGQHPFEVLEVSDASVTDAGGGGQRVATVTFIAGPDSPPAARLVDDAGNVIDTLSVTTTESRGRFTLVAVDDPILPWRVLLAEDVGPVT